MARPIDKNRGLGRGLSALLADVNVTNEGIDTAGDDKGIQNTIPIEFIYPNKSQPRKIFDEEELQNLANSIGEKGVIQPLILKKISDKEYQIVAGERRWRAAQIAKLHALPAVVREYTDVEVQEIALIENIQRADLNVLEEAQAYQALMDKHGHTQERLSQTLGKSRSHIANLLRLLTLSESTLDFVRRGQLSMGHARALVGAPNQTDIARRIAKEGLSVRQVEALVKAGNVEKKDKPAKQTSQKDADTQSLERELSASTGKNITIEHKPNGTGVVKISYRDLEELDDICGLLSLNK